MSSSSEARPAGPPPTRSLPNRFLLRMVLFLAVVVAIVVLLYPTLIDAFLVNPFLNGIIVGVLLLGIGYTFRQVLMLRREENWLFQARFDGGGAAPAPRLLAPMANMLAERKGRISLSALAMRSLLDGIAARLDESRELSRYLIGLLIFLGLLGTFWGLLQTIGAVSDVVGTLSLTGNDLAAMFNDLREGLRAPLSGMGTAFSSSLFGLAGSLVLGFLDLQAGQAQNRFFNDLEDWLSGSARITTGGGMVESEQSIPAYLQALLEQTAENIDSLQRTLSHSEEGRRSANQNLMALTERLSVLTDQMRAEQNLLLRLAEGQMELRPVLARLAEAAGSGGFGIDEGSRQHIRNMEMYLARVAEEMSIGRTQTVQEIRSEIKLLARTIAALAEEPER